jgi:sulfotransferase 6B1
MPKAGTHLLASLLDELPEMRYSGVHHGLNQFRAYPGDPLNDGSGADWARLRASLSKVGQGQYVTGHFPAASPLFQVLDELEYRPILILRDPRDMAVSHVFYVMGLPRHPLHQRYRALPDMNARMMAYITGSEGDGWGPATRPVDARLREYLPWADEPGCLVLRFEDLVGSRGGGESGRQLLAIEAVARHVDRPLLAKQVDQIALRIFSTGSATFRRGEIGDWKNHFNDAHKAAFKEGAGELLIRLGYETDDAW